MNEFGTEGVHEPSRGERARSASADVRVAGSPPGEVGADAAASMRAFNVILYVSIVFCFVGVVLSAR